MNKIEKTKVVFRVYPSGEVIALFPQIPDDYTGWCCISYMRVGQHGGALSDLVIERTRLAMPKQYRELKKELRQLGYDLQVGKKCTAQDREVRRQKAKQFA